MTKRDIVIFLFKWWNSLLGYWILVVLLCSFLVYSLPQQYEATAKILVESNRAPVMRADSVFGVENLNFLNSAIQIIRSRPVLEATARRVEAYNRRKAAEAGEGPPPGGLVLALQRLGDWTIEVGLRNQGSQREDLISELEDSLVIEPQPNSDVITISHRNYNPELAAMIVNTVTKHYIDQHLKIYSSGGTSKIYSQQIDRLEADLKRQREELAGYKRDKSITALGDTRRALVQRQTKLNADVSNIERELAELRTLYSEGHTTVVLAKGKLESTRRELAQIAENLRELETQEATIRDMEVEISSIELTLQNYRKLFEDQQLVSLANPDVVNILIIESATVPSKPIHSRLFYIVLAVLGGLLLSFAIAFIKEYLDNRVTDPRVAAELLGVPTLGSIEKA